MAAFTMASTTPRAVAAEQRAAQEFISSVYRPYGDAAAYPNGPSYYGAAESAVFTKRLSRLLAEDSPAGQLGRLDYDPLCACQDAEGLKLVSQSVERLDAANARVRVVLQIDGRKQEVTLHLSKVDGQWRIADISNAYTKSLMKFLASGERPRAAAARLTAASALAHLEP